MHRRVNYEAWDPPVSNLILASTLALSAMHKHFGAGEGPQWAARKPKISTDNCVRKRRLCSGVLALELVVVVVFLGCRPCASSAQGDVAKYETELDVTLTTHSASGVGGLWRDPVCQARALMHVSIHVAASDS